jgi:hypothetical protein
LNNHRFAFTPPAVRRSRLLCATAYNSKQRSLHFYTNLMSNRDAWKVTFQPQIPTNPERGLGTLALVSRALFFHPPLKNREGVMADPARVKSLPIFATAAVALAALVIIIGSWILDDAVDLAPTAHLSH